MKQHSSFTRLIIAAFLTIGGHVSLCQKTITGKVIDAASRQPLEAVSVADASEKGPKTITDHYGNFIFAGKKNIESLNLSYVDYKLNKIKVDRQEELKIEMQPDVLDMKDVVVLQNNSATKFSIVSKIDLDLKPVRNTQELLRLVAGLFIAQHAGGGKAEQIFLRGFDCDHGTDVQVSVDGMPVNMVSHAHG